MYFLDRYAIIEMTRGNPRYLRYRSEPSITARAHLLGVYYILTQQGNEILARAALRALGPLAIELPIELIPKIALFRLRQLGATGRRFSYVDALGYVYARENGYTLLTGAHEFEGLPDVDYVR
jgi:hypothetical protein